MILESFQKEECSFCFRITKLWCMRIHLISLLRVCLTTSIYFLRSYCKFMENKTPILYMCPVLYVLKKNISMGSAPPPMILHKPSDTGHCVHLQMKKQKFKEVIRLNQVPTVNGVIQIYGLVSKMLLFSTHLVVFLINSLAKGLPQSKPRCCPAPNFLPLEPAWQI